MWCQHKWCAFRSHAHVLNISFCIYTCIPEVHLQQIIQCVAVCCSVLQCVAVCCIVYINVMPIETMHLRYASTHTKYIILYIHIHTRGARIQNNTMISQWYVMMSHWYHLMTLCTQHITSIGITLIYTMSWDDMWWYHIDMWWYHIDIISWHCVHSDHQSFLLASHWYTQCHETPIQMMRLQHECTYTKYIFLYIYTYTWCAHIQLINFVHSCGTNTNDAPSVRMHIY